MSKTGQPESSSRKTLMVLAASAVAAFAAGLAPDPVVRPSAWAADNIVVPDGPYAGERWSAEVAPHLVEPLDCLAPSHPCTSVTVRKSAQTGFTGAGIAWLGLLIDTAPADMLAVQPTVDAAMAFNRDKLQRTIDGSPVLRRKVADATSRTGRGSTTFHKFFPGGSLTLAGANSTAGLRSKTVRYVLADEIDEWPADLDGQGDPMKMVDARQMSFHALGGYKKLQGSTATLKGASRIDDAYEAGDQRYRHLPCPGCGTEQLLVFENLKFEKTWPHKAVYICTANGCVIPHSEKRGMLAELRVLPGLYRHRITDESACAFFEDTWQVANEADRIAYRFRGGRALEFVERVQPFGAGSDPPNIVDSCYPYGSIQVPGGTEPIVLHRDAVSGGGYFMLGTVISADMDLIGQLQPHVPTKFVSVDMETALAARHDRQASLAKVREALG